MVRRLRAPHSFQEDSVEEATKKKLNKLSPTLPEPLRSKVHDFMVAQLDTRAPILAAEHTRFREACREINDVVEAAYGELTDVQRGELHELLAHLFINSVITQALDALLLDIDGLCCPNTSTEMAIVSAAQRHLMGDTVQKVLDLLDRDPQPKIRHVGSA